MLTWTEVDVIDGHKASVDCGALVERNHLQNDEVWEGGGVGQLFAGPVALRSILVGPHHHRLKTTAVSAIESTPYKHSRPGLFSY